MGKDSAGRGATRSEDEVISLLLEGVGFNEPHFGFASLFWGAHGLPDVGRR